MIAKRCKDERVFWRSQWEPVLQGGGGVIWPHEPAEPEFFWRAPAPEHIERMASIRQDFGEGGMTTGEWVVFYIVGVAAIGGGWWLVHRLIRAMDSGALVLPKFDGEGWGALVLAALLLVALAPWPYEFYMLLRVAVCGGGAYLAYTLWGWKRGLAFALAGIAVLFNPFVPAQLNRETWAVLNAVAAAMFAYTGWQFRHRPTP